MCTYVLVYMAIEVEMSSKLFLAQLRLLVLVLGASWGTADSVGKMSEVSRENTSDSIQIRPSRRKKWEMIGKILKTFL